MSEFQNGERLFAEAVEHHKAGRLKEAEKAYRAVIALQPRHASAFDALGRLAFKAEQYATSVDLFRKAIVLEPQSAGFHLNLGNVLDQLNRADEAIDCYRRAIGLEPNLAAAHGNLGNIYVSQGRREEACHAFARAIEFAPRRGSYYRMRALVEPLRADDPLFARMEHLIRPETALSDLDRVELHFALGTAYGDRGDYKRSFAHLLEGNALKRKHVSYDEEKVLGLLSRIETVFRREFLESRRDFGLATRAPIFVVGMPRSGSSLVEQILASHPDVFGAGEVQILPRLLRRFDSTVGRFPDTVPSLSSTQIHHLAEQYLATLRIEAPTAIHVVDKFLDNFMALGLISLMFPEAKVIHVQRDPVDTCLSCFALLFSGHISFAYDLGELGRFYRAYARLMDHWRAVLPAGRMLEVRYEELVTNFEAQARAIMEHCGLAWDERCRNFYKTRRLVRTSSALQVRQPIYQTAMTKWHAYRDLAQPLIETLAGAD